jgi:hypothetical protein
MVLLTFNTLTLILKGKMSLLKEWAFLLMESCIWDRSQALMVMVTAILTVKSSMENQLILITTLGSLLLELKET